MVGALAQEQGASLGVCECEWTRFVGGSSLGELACRGRARAPERHLLDGGALAVVKQGHSSECCWYGKRVRGVLVKTVRSLIGFIMDVRIDNRMIHVHRPQARIQGLSVSHPCLVTQDLTENLMTASFIVVLLSYIRGRTMWPCFLLFLDWISDDGGRRSDNIL